MDSSIVSIFGQPPPSIDLSESTTVYDNSVVIALSVLAVVAVGGRIWARRIKQAAFGLDDVLVFFALAFELVTMILTILGGHYGSGQHIWNLQMSQLKMIFKVLYGYTFVYGAAAAAIKLSFVLFFARVFDTGNPVTYAGCRNYTRVALWTGGSLACIYPIVVWSVMLGVCTPINYFWNQYTSPEDGSCIDSTLFFLVAGIINMLIDLVILLIPLPCILQLQMKRTERIMLTCIFMLGSFVLVASVMRIYYLQVLRTSTDVTYPMGNVFIWSSVEPAIGIVSSCLISIRPALQRLLSMVFRTTFASRSDQTQSHKRPCIVFDGHQQEDEIVLVQANFDKRSKQFTSDDRVLVTREFGVRSKSTLIGTGTSIS